jgi:ABC-type taurine transport system substrate-binding protein
LVPLGLNAQTTFSETTRYDKLRSGEWDVMAMTLDSFARQSDPQIGAITTLINERAGAEKLVVTPDIATVNDLQGKRVAININNTSHGFFLYYALNLAGLTTAQISLISYQTEAEAVQAYLNGAADAVIANEPEVLAAEQNKGTVLITSDTLRTTIDVLVTSRPALTTKTEAVQAFHDAWYEALQLVIDSPDEAGGMIVAWNQADWTSVTQPEGFATQLEKLAQATLGSNQLAFQQQGTLINRLQDAQRVWSVVGGQPAAQVDFAPMIDGQFVLATSKADRFFSSQSPVNDSFLLTSRVEVPGIAAQNTQATQSFVKLKLEQIPFDADSAQLSDQAIADLNEQVLPVLKASNLYLQIQGGSAWPGPRGRFSEEDIDQFARQRAVAVASFLTRQGIDPNRLLLLDILESQYPESLNESELAQDRRVRFVLVGGGR